MNSFTFSTVKTIIKQRGGGQKTGELLAKNGCRNILVVTDKGLAATGHLETITNSVKKAGSASICYPDVVSDPSEKVVLEAVEQARKHQVDGIVGIGGGSALDTAKAVAVLAKSEIPLPEIYGFDQIKDGRLPLFLIPTTAGTGSEVTASTVISNDKGQKNVALDPALYADIALLDADFLNTMPYSIATTTGVDAIVHAIEGYTSRTKRNPLSNMLACQALRLLLQNFLPSLEDDKPNKQNESRERMLLGSMLAGQAFSNSSVSAVHAFAYALAETAHLSHGLSNSLALMPVLRFNISIAPEIYGTLAKESFPEQTSGMGTVEAAEYLLTELENILITINLNKKLHEFNINEKDICEMAKSVSNNERLLNNNPCPITEEDAKNIFQKIL